MFCSPIQQADPFAYWSPSPSYGYSRQPSYHYQYHQPDPYTRAVMQEQARREQARREAIAQRRAYEAYMRKEAARRRAAEEEAAAAEYRQAVMNKILKAYAAQAHAQHQEEEEDDDEQVQLRQQTRIPISSFASDRGSEDEVEQDEASEHGDYEAEEEEELTQESQNMKDEFARDSTPNQPKISYEEAVAIVQKHAQVALLVRRRLASLNKIRENFLSQQRSFRPPKTLDFDIQKSQRSDQPILAYTPNNRPLQAHEENLLRLLTDLDDIPSGGFDKVKKERKALARTIQSELDRIDAYKVQQWQQRR